MENFREQMHMIKQLMSEFKKLDTSKTETLDAELVEKTLSTTLDQITIQLYF